AGDPSGAAKGREQRLRDAGFAPPDSQGVDPFPKKGNLVLRFPGDGTRWPLLLLAHLDVVEAKREEWQTDPFTLVETDGYFTARGAADDKAMAAAFVSILSQLKREGFTPHRDLILALTADEERGGVSTNGARWLTQTRREWIDAEFGINEGGGGELISGKPTIQRIQVAEKIYTTYELVAHNAGGHSSLPRPDNAIYELTGAVSRIGQYTFPVKLGPVTRDYFARSAAFFTGQRARDMQSVGAGQTDPDTIARLSMEPLYNATLRTTCVTTMLSAGHAETALAQTARATVNCRVLPWDELAEVDQKLKELVGTPTIEITQTMAPTTSPPSPLTATILEPVEQISAELWPGVPVIPTLSTGATDSLWLRNAGIPMYGVSGIFVDVNDVHAHGLNERVEQGRLYEGREFLYRLIKRLAG